MKCAEVCCGMFPICFHHLSFSLLLSLSPIQGRDNLTHEKERFAHEHAQMKKLEDVVKELKPTAIIGIYKEIYTAVVPVRTIVLTKSLSSSLQGWQLSLVLSRRR